MEVAVGVSGADAEGEEISRVMCRYFQFVSAIVVFFMNDFGVWFLYDASEHRQPFISARMRIHIHSGIQTNISVVGCPHQ